MVCGRWIMAVPGGRFFVFGSRDLTYPHKLRALLYPLQPLRVAQFPKCPQTLVADVISALVAKCSTALGRGG